MTSDRTYRTGDTLIITRGRYVGYVCTIQGVTIIQSYPLGTRGSLGYVVKVNENDKVAVVPTDGVKPPGEGSQ